jgi:hypothetical protein
MNTVQVKPFAVSFKVTTSNESQPRQLLFETMFKKGKIVVAAVVRHPLISVATMRRPVFSVNKQVKQVRFLWIKETSFNSNKELINRQEVRGLYDYFLQVMTGNIPPTPFQ